jgi:hypothetical protein
MDPRPSADIVERDERPEVARQSPRSPTWFWWVLTALLLSVLVIIATWFDAGFVPTRPYLAGNAEAEPPYPYPTPCIPVISQPEFPLWYPGAINTVEEPISPEEDANWTPLLFTRTFQTLDSPGAVLDFYQKGMPNDGWRSEYVPPEVTKTPGIWWPLDLDPAVGTLPGIVGILAFIEPCPYSYHFHYVHVVVRRPSGSSPTVVNMRVYEYRH